MLRPIFPAILALLALGLGACSSGGGSGGSGGDDETILRLSEISDYYVVSGPAYPVHLDLQADDEKVIKYLVTEDYNWSYDPIRSIDPFGDPVEITVNSGSGRSFRIQGDLAAANGSTGTDGTEDLILDVELSDDLAEGTITATILDTVALYEPSYDLYSHEYTWFAVDWGSVLGPKASTTLHGRLWRIRDLAAAPLVAGAWSTNAQLAPTEILALSLDVPPGTGGIRVWATAPVDPLDPEGAAEPHDSSLMLCRPDGELVEMWSYQDRSHPYTTPPPSDHVVDPGSYLLILHPSYYGIDQVTPPARSNRQVKFEYLPAPPG